MKKYEAAKPLLSLHIPKCGGQSVRRVLKSWFGDNLYFHYFQKRNDLPEKHGLKPGMCIHGHFNKDRGFGTDDYYPEIDQFITFLRDPLEIVISNYFFWKRKARDRQIKLGIIQEGGDHDYRDIEDFFRKRPTSHIPDFLPGHLSEQNFKEVFEEKFIYIGVVEDMETSMNMLARKLGHRLADEVWLNRSERDEEVTPETKQRFIENNSFAYAMYDFVLKNYKK